MQMNPRTYSGKDPGINSQVHDSLQLPLRITPSTTNISVGLQSMQCNSRPEIFKPTSALGQRLYRCVPVSAGQNSRKFSMPDRTIRTPNCALGPVHPYYNLSSTVGQMKGSKIKPGLRSYDVDFTSHTIKQTCAVLVVRQDPSARVALQEAASRLADHISAAQIAERILAAQAAKRVAAALPHPQSSAVPASNLENQNSQKEGPKNLTSANLGTHISSAVSSQKPCNQIMRAQSTISKNTSSQNTVSQNTSSHHLYSKKPELNSSPPVTQTLELSKKENHINIRRQLIMILHADHCRHDQLPECCELLQCTTFKAVLAHMASCQLMEKCLYQHCHSSRRIYRHWHTCWKSTCPICQPLIVKLAERRTSPSGA